MPPPRNAAASRDSPGAMSRLISPSIDVEGIANGPPGCPRPKCLRGERLYENKGKGNIGPKLKDFFEDQYAKP
jgi:hypothetical protein